MWPRAARLSPAVRRTCASLTSSLARVREAGPLVQCITNTVVQNFTANALLAIGAAPAMTDIVGEAGTFAGIADALLINLGTPTPEQRAAAVEAARAANEASTPWVLDPVAVGALPLRTELARELVALGPTAIRGNASEIAVLAGSGAGGRGMEASEDIDAAAAVALARESGAIVAVSGPQDLITDGRRVLRVDNGDALLTKVTGGGCTLGAVVAAFLSVERSPDSVAQAHAYYGAAAEVAAESAHGPGSFAVALIDALSTDLPASLLRIREEPLP
ncbi:hydroxyethylthiazole kinase [Corynebacterium sp. BCW_4722]|nr:hydroxyethylthiazole kinase [Corynebacterium sp. BCW_4722]